MANNVVQGILQLIAMASCVYGVYAIYGLSSNTISLIYNALWFILGFFSNFTGLGSILLHYLGSEDSQDGSVRMLTYHYLFSWFAVVIGYPSLVTQFWLSYYPTPLAHVLVALSVIPMVAWAGQNNVIIIATTQAVTGIAIFAHLYICYLTQNIYGMIGAAVMIFIIVSLSIPTRHNLLGISSKEAFVVGLASASYIFSLAVSHMVHNPTIVKSLIPY